MSSNQEHDNLNNETLRALNDNVIHLTKTLDRAAKSSEKYSDVTLGFTLILFLVAFLQLIVTIQALNQPWHIELIIILLLSGGIYFAMKKIFNWIDKKHKN